MTRKNLLIELGTEELPPKSLKNLASSFASNVEQQLVNANLSFEGLKWFASPRRLAIKITALQVKQQDQQIEKRGPSIQMAFDDNGHPTKAAQGWARSNGIGVEQATRLTTDKGEWLLYKSMQPGLHVSELIEEILNKAIAKLPIPKPMRWGDKSTQFIRPVHTLTLLLGSQVLSANILGVQSTNILRGHRFHGDQTVSLDHADNYEIVLKSNYVIADFETRKQLIWESVVASAKQYKASVEFDEALLDEVTGLVEWPVALVAQFDESFLRVPKEALIYTMKDDQKYFPMLAEDGSLLPRFVFVSNIESENPELVISGNQRVIRPRLADAQFFFDTDRKTKLSTNLDKLNSIVFQQQLGTLADKSNRVAELAKVIASSINADQEHSYRAGLLSKADLVTKMVYEFPDVQGVMGMHYARLDGEPEEVALALNEQYMPRFSGDALPSGKVSCSVSMAEKFDTLVGIFGIGQPPKGDKDPFALRRAAIGILRILIENGISLDVKSILEKASQLYGSRLSSKHTSEVFSFILNRYRAYYLDKGISAETIISVEKLAPSDPIDFDARIQAVTHFQSLPESTSLAAANKRVSNILAKQTYPAEIGLDSSLLIEPAEKKLYKALIELEDSVKSNAQQRDYKAALISLSLLREPVDEFFDNVMVIVDDIQVRNNRLALLASLRSLFLGVADISELG